MTWPTGAVPTANLDAGTDNAAAARADILLAVQKLNELIASGEPTGRLIKVTRLTSAGSGTFTPQTSTKTMIVKVQGAGGGGGYSAAAASGQYVIARSGSGGAYCEARLAWVGGETISYTVGAGGAGGTSVSTNGANGGASSVTFSGGRIIYANGGTRGTVGVSRSTSTTQNILLAVGGSSNSVTGLGASDLIIVDRPGQSSSNALFVSGSSSISGCSSGGSANGFAIPVPVTNDAAAGDSATPTGHGYGVGGVGGITFSGSSTAANGGAGSGGFVEFWEYA